MYQPDIGRWGAIDNKSEKYVSSTPYAYAADNPIIFIDPDGNEIGNPNSEDTKRIKSTLLKTETGAKVWKQMEDSKRVIYFHIADGDSKSDKGIQNHLRDQNAVGETMTGKMFDKVKEGKEVDDATRESAYSFNEETGEYDKTSDWDETHVVFDGQMLENKEQINEAMGGVNGAETAEAAAHEGKHTVQNYADFTTKQKDPKTGKFRDPKKDKDKGASRSVPYEKARHEREADAVGKKTRKEYEGQ